MKGLDMKLKKLLMIPLLLFAMVGIATAASYQIGYQGSSHIDTAGLDFSGSGQNDINVTGTYTGDSAKCYEVQATATSTFKWRASCTFGAYTTGVSMTTSAAELENGIKVHWDTATGHTNTDSWKFKVKAVNPMRITDPAGNNLFNIQNDKEINLFNSVMTSQNSFVGMKAVDDSGTTYVKYNRGKVELHSIFYQIVAKDSGKHFTTDTAVVEYKLPTASAGLWFKFSVGANGGDITVTENGGDTIGCGASSSGVSIQAPTAYDSIILEAVDATTWICSSPIPTIGDWTFN
jgi:hypothetical protein